jgi:hypothetical protein
MRRTITYDIHEGKMAVLSKRILNFTRTGELTRREAEDKLQAIVDEVQQNFNDKESQIQITDQDTLPPQDPLRNSTAADILFRLRNIGSDKDKDLGL